MYNSDGYYRCREKHYGKSQYDKAIAHISAMENMNKSVVSCQQDEKKFERVVWFKHDVGHVNMAFIDYDG